LNTQFATEITRSGDRIRAGIAPYSRFVRSEGEKLQAMEQELQEVSARMESLRVRIQSRSAIEAGKPK
jgi:hypothetical protein